MYEDVEKTGGWIFVIDTQDYAGNFERELTAYITGMVGDCRVGEDMVEYYKEETGDGTCEKFSDLLEYRPDENGCARPCAIYPTKGWFNHGMGGHFKDGDEEKALKDYVNQCEKIYGKEYMANPLAAKKSLENGKPYSNWTLAAVEKEVKRLNKQIDDAKKLTKVHKHQAYLSVAIFFHAKPSDEIIALMKQRAADYCKAAKKENDKRGFKMSPEKLKITGFRLVKETTSMKEVAV